MKPILPIKLVVRQIFMKKELFFACRHGFKAEKIAKISYMTKIRFFFEKFFQNIFFLLETLKYEFYTQKQDFFFG